jgi:integrase
MAQHRRPTPPGKSPKRLVATRATGLPPGTFTDAGQTGLQLRVRRRRNGFSRTWLLRFKFRGEETRILIGHFPETSLEAARGLARHYRELASQGIDPRRARPRRSERPSPIPISSAPANPGDKHTVEFLASEFMERYVKPRRKHPEYAQAILNLDVLPTWKGRDARTIAPGEVIELLDGIVDRGSRVKANRTAGLLSQMFRFGIHRRIVASTPVQLLFRPGGQEKPRQRTLTNAELQAFLADPKDATRYERLGHVITLLLLTGQRRGELALARWSEIDFKAKSWTIPDENAKAGRGHVVPLSDWAAKEFEALKRLSRGSQWVLPDTDDENHLDPKLLTRGVAKCQERFIERGIGAWTLHDLRRTCRTGLAKLGVTPHIAERVLNHAQERIPGTYDVHQYLNEKRVALEQWATHLAALRSSAKTKQPGASAC